MKFRSNSDRIPRLLLCMLLLVVIGGQPEKVAGAEKFPTRPLEMIVPSHPGGGTDILARLLVESLEPFLEQKVVVVNKPGASCTIGATELVKAKPDGYTIMCAHNPPPLPWRLMS